MCSTRSIEITFDFVSFQIITFLHSSQIHWKVTQKSIIIPGAPNREKTGKPLCADKGYYYQRYSSSHMLGRGVWWHMVCVAIFRKPHPCQFTIVDFKTFSILSSSQLHFITYNQQKIRMRKAGFS